MFFCSTRYSNKLIKLHYESNNFMGLRNSKSMKNTYYEINISLKDVLNVFYSLFTWILLIFILLNKFYYTFHKINIKYWYLNYIDILCVFICMIIFGQTFPHYKSDLSLQYMRNLVKTITLL